MEKPCDVCNEEKEGTTCLIYHPEPNQIVISPVLMRGKNWFVCIECNMCYLAQYMEMTNKEIIEWCDWIHQDVIRQGQP